MQYNDFGSDTALPNVVAVLGGSWRLGGKPGALGGTCSGDPTAVAVARGTWSYPRYPVRRLWSVSTQCRPLATH